MKKGWLLILLVSLGLNLGLGLRMLQIRREEPPRPGEMMRHRLEDRMEDRMEGRLEGRPEDQGGPAHALADSGRWGDFAKQRLQRMAERLDLSPDQITLLSRAQETRGPLLHRNRLQVERIRLSLHEMMQADPVDEARVRAAIADLSRRQTALDSLATEALLQEIQILEPNQRERYLRMLPLQGGRPMAGGGRRGPGRYPGE